MALINRISDLEEKVWRLEENLEKSKDDSNPAEKSIVTIL